MRPWYVVGLILLVSACSASTGTVDRSTTLLSDAPAPHAGCQILFAPNPLPSLSQVADSAALAGAILQYAKQYPMRGGAMRALYTVGFDASGRVERLSPIDYLLPQGQVEAMTSLVRSHLRPQPGSAGNFRLLVEPGAENGAVRLGRSERCPPRSNTAFRLVAPAVIQLQKPEPVRLRLRVSAQGLVVASEVLSSSGSQELDRWVLQVLQRHEFSPGLLDGVAVAMDHEETVRIQARP